MKRSYILICVVVLLMAGCAPIGQDAAVPASDTNQTENRNSDDAPAVQAQAESAVEEPVAEEASVEVEVEAEAKVDAEAQDENDGSQPDAVADIDPPPTFSPHLKATDPATVLIGNGRPQVIEFFAFW